MSSEEVRRLVIERARAALRDEYGGVLIGGARRNYRTRGRGASGGYVLEDMVGSGRYRTCTKMRKKKPKRCKKYVTNEISNKQQRWQDLVNRVQLKYGLRFKDALIKASQIRRRQQTRR